MNAIQFPSHDRVKHKYFNRILLHHFCCQANLQVCNTLTLKNIFIHPSSKRRVFSLSSDVSLLCYLKYSFFLLGTSLLSFRK